MYLQQINTELDEILYDVKLEEGIYIALMVIVTLGCTFISFGYAWCINKMTDKLQNFAVKMSSKTAELSREKKRTDMLLHQV